MRKADIEKLFEKLKGNVQKKTIDHMILIYQTCGEDSVFSRFNVEQITGLKTTRASELINLMLENEIIVPIKGQGKGKYIFR